MPCQCGNKVGHANAPTSSPVGALGSDYGSAEQFEPFSLGVRGPTNPATNQANTGVVLPSAQATAMRRALPSLVRMVRPRVFINTSVRGNIGAVAVRAASVIPVYSEPGYMGELPLTMQPKINKPLPYK